MQREDLNRTTLLGDIENAMLRIFEDQEHVPRQEIAAAVQAFAIPLIIMLFCGTLIVLMPLLLVLLPMKT